MFCLYLGQPSLATPTDHICSVIMTWINFSYLFQSETAPISGSFFDIQSFLLLILQFLCLMLKEKVHVCTKILLDTITSVLSSLLLSYLGTTGIKQAGTCKLYQCFFLCKKQVRLDLNCVKYEWEVGGTWEKSVTKFVPSIVNANSLAGLKPQDRFYDEKMLEPCP